MPRISGDIRNFQVCEWHVRIYAPRSICQIHTAAAFLKLVSRPLQTLQWGKGIACGGCCVHWPCCFGNLGLASVGLRWGEPNNYLIDGQIKFDDLPIGKISQNIQLILRCHLSSSIHIYIYCYVFTYIYIYHILHIYIYIYICIYTYTNRKLCFLPNVLTLPVTSLQRLCQDSSDVTKAFSLTPGPASRAAPRAPRALRAELRPRPAEVPSHAGVELITSYN